MKSGVAAFVAAAIDAVATNPPAGSIVITLTGDEEGEGVDGTLALADKQLSGYQALFLLCCLSWCKPSPKTRISQEFSC